MGSSKDHLNFGDSRSFKDLLMEATYYNGGSHNDERQHESQGAPTIVSESSESSRNGMAAARVGMHYQRVHAPLRAPYDPFSRVPALPPHILQPPFLPLSNAAAPFGHTLHAHQYPTPSGGVLSLEDFAAVRAEVIAASNPVFPSPIGQPSAYEISAAYQALARAAAPVSIPQVSLAPPGWPLSVGTHLDTLPGAHLLTPMVPNHLAHPSVYEILARATAPVSILHAFQAGLPPPPPPPPGIADFHRLAGRGTLPHPGGYDLAASLPPPYYVAPGVPRNTAPVPAPVDGHADTPPRPCPPFQPLSEARLEKREVSASSLEAERSDRKAAVARARYQRIKSKIPKGKRKPMNPICTTLTKECMIKLMEKFGPTVWHGVKEPRLDFDMLRKERDINGVRQTFFRWNPNFTDHFEYTPETGWLPILGEETEIERRAEIRNESRGEREKNRETLHQERRRRRRKYKDY